ncbi:hypothetical protein ON010_g17368 [Phytophthora cinnamomi]|nr:hypothetical protein ON010_g17368 [Phytophthora cinnamomi]
MNGSLPGLVHDLVVGPHDTYLVELHARVPNEPAQLETGGSANLSGLGRAGTALKHPARRGGNLDVHDARVIMVRTPVGLQAVEALTRVQSERLRGTDVAAVELIDPLPPASSYVDADAIHIHAGADRDGVHGFSGRCKARIRKQGAERFARDDCKCLKEELHRRTLELVRGRMENRE